jgi:hypothetical protein
VSLHKLVGTHPVQKVLTAIPKCEYNIWLAFVDGTKDVIGNKSGHFVDEAGPISEALFEGIRIFWLNVDTIRDSYHFGVLPLLDDSTFADLQGWEG